MNSIKSAYPPLTPDDIFTLRGKPMAKKINPVVKSSNQITHSVEEWIYYHNDIKESYLFRNGHLVRWVKKTISI